MGSAAYRRGSAVIRRTLDAEQRDPHFVLMEELNALARYADAGTPFAPTVIVYEPVRQLWWQLDPNKMWAGRGYAYTSLRDLCRLWHITLTGYDATTQTWTAVPRSARLTVEDCWGRR